MRVICWRSSSGTSARAQKSQSAANISPMGSAPALPGDPELPRVDRARSRAGESVYRPLVTLTTLRRLMSAIAY